ncbi:hypothetical protein DMN91_009020 [Ooceraea biroi]|uniref:DUF4794 domain-containing protein n=1 Tax=Ooceraea biroi TaxID=2015173 RepID=A0A3L8DET0_OOCBI|nr:uncharacterized protein LOC105276038 [Ooceraea biroi]RLU18663.1 hypothetical protein DMN91_009020 [Ooceraea biroi]
MKIDLPLKVIMLPVILLLFAGTLRAKPIDYEDVENLLPTEPQTTNDTLAVIVQDPVVQDAVQNAVGNGSLQGLVVKKKVLIMPATEPTKVVSQREQVLVVPVTHLEDVRKNITESATAEDNVGDLVVLPEVQSFVRDNEDAYASLANYEGALTDSSQHDDFYEMLTEIPKITRKPTFPVDNAPQEIPYLLPNPTQEELPAHPSISVPIIAFLDPSRISDDKINAPIAAALPRRDGTPNQLDLSKNERNQIQRDVQDYIDGDSWGVDLDNWRRASPPSEIEASSLLFEPTTMETQYMSGISSENSLPLVMPYSDIVTPLFWTADANDDYPKNPHDMNVAADIVFRPLFRYRQEAQQRSYRRSAYRRYNSYPRRNYRYRSRYSNDYYY